MNQAVALFVFLAVALAVVGQILFFIWVVRKIRKSNPIDPEALYLFMRGFALTAFLAAIGFSIYTIALLKTGERVSGTVIGLRESNDKNHSRAVAPTVRFVAQNGATNILESGLYSYPPDYQVGDVIPIIYRGSDPTSARINRTAENWMAPAVLAFIGGALLIFVPVHKKWRQWRQV